MRKFSIVIPVYNVENYIQECLESVLKQTYEKLEIILVNDGSTDKSPIICDEYSKIDSRVKVIHKENGGLSSARNSGFNETSGEYIVFVDSDDWLHIDFIKHINDTINDAEVDVIVNNVVSYDEGNDVSKEQNYNLPIGKVYSGVEAFKHLYSQNEFWGAAWQFVVRREYLIKNNIVFTNGIYHEDERYSPELLLLTTKVGFCSQALYMYRLGRQGSIINNFNIKKEFDKIFIISDLMKLSNSTELSGIRSHLLQSRCTQLYVGLIKTSYKYLKLNNIQSKELADQLKELRYVLKFNNSIKYKIFYIAVTILGPIFLGKMLNSERYSNR
ncbi:glycosyltransferase [Paenibacillus sp. L3-i20]|uniref:glycosyltransferase n=1 Tax=Paenibacillus sp. L3-i20 TaxID=2905833 RepID=UPI001EDF8403|nr:glycosyltransferase [Paenibacillus sp. L3-i20]GKU77024.1 glycosyl transferase [Paenibacillus sp. L3-i20]